MDIQSKKKKLEAELQKWNLDYTNNPPSKEDKNSRIVEGNKIREALASIMDDPLEGYIKIEIRCDSCGEKGFVVGSTHYFNSITQEECKGEYEKGTHTFVLVADTIKARDISREEVNNHLCGPYHEE